MFFKKLLKQLLLTDKVLDHIQQKMETIMASLQNFKDLLAAVDAETNRIAAKIQSLVDGLSGGGMTDAEEAEALAGLSAVADRLKTIGADPSNPVPPVPPEEPPTI